MKAKVKSEEFGVAIDAIANLVEEGTFKVEEEGITFTAMDPSQISLVRVEIPKEAFSEYQTNPEKAEAIGIDINKLNQILKRGKEKETIELETENGLSITFSGEGRNRKFTLPLLDLGETQEKVPNIEYPAEVKLEPSLLRNILEDAGLIGSHIKFTLTAENVFRAEAHEDVNTMKEEFELGGESIKREKEGEFTAVFPLTYLKDMVKASTPYKTISLNMATDKPLTMKYGKDIEVTYFLAPRIEG